ncbi:MAG: hypothetical protein ACI9S8_001955 [Chlamydiales bacterium]|jgi:hypothetical protein
MKKKVQVEKKIGKIAKKGIRKQKPVKESTLLREVRVLKQTSTIHSPPVLPALFISAPSSEPVSPEQSNKKK